MLAQREQFINLGLIDEYMLVVVPIVLGSGTPLFKDVRTLNLELFEARNFKNGNAVLRYQPARTGKGEGIS
jgi:dihydrofolate reductase